MTIFKITNVPLVIIIIIIFIINYINGFNIKSSTIIEKNTNVLGVEFDYALMDLEFDREVYRVRNIPCGNFDCTLPKVNGVDCSCNYADKDNCGQLDESCVSNGFSCDMTLCNGTVHQWEQIEANQPFNFQSNQVFEIRFKANSDICEGIRIEASQNQGRFHMVVTNANREAGRSSPNVNPDSFIQPAFCPSDNGYFAEINNSSLDVWNLDTYFITIIPDSIFIDFNITIISNEIKPIAELPTTTCQNITSDHICIIDGIPVTGHAKMDGEFFWYTFEVSKAGVYSFSAPAINQDIDFFVSDDPSNMYPTYDNPSKWDCSNENDDYLVLSLKPNDDGTPKILYISVTAFYASEFVFTVTSLGYQELVPIHNNFARGGAFSLLGSSRLILPNNSVYKCSFWFLCTYFTILFPFQESFPVWPIPTQFADDYRFNQITYYSDDNIPAKSHYSAAFLLSTTEGDFQQLNKEFNDLVNASIEFLSVLVDKDLNPLEGIFRFNLTNLNCDYKEFDKVLEKMDLEEGKLYNSTDFGVVNSIIFNIDTLTLSNSWTACSQRAKSYLQTSDKLVNKSLSICSYSPTDPQYDLDPCCNVTLSFFQCCQPKNIQVNISEFVDVHKGLVGDQCFSPDCTESVLREYYNSLSVVGECDVPAFVSTNSAIEMRTILRECKDSIKSKRCISNSDCIEYGDDTICELYTRTCMVPPEQLDRIYLTCVFESLPAAYTYTFLNSHGLQQNETMIDDIFYATAFEDCTYVSGFSYRTSYSYDSEDIDESLGYRCYRTDNCLDLSCQTVHDVCFDGQVGNWHVYAQSSICDELGFCPVAELCNDLENENSADCEQACNNLSEYCGYCSSNSTDCFRFKESTSQTTCENKDACLLPNGEYQFGITPAACQAKGQCDVPCGQECVGSGFTGCSFVGIGFNDQGGYYEYIYYNEAECKAQHKNATWDADLELCYRNDLKSKSTCEAQSNSNFQFSWIACESLGQDECFDPLYGTCYLEDIECKDKASCENAGKCSDSYFFDPENTPVYPKGLGKCVKGHFVYKTGFFIPSCDCYIQNDSPMGCFRYSPEFGKQSCLERADEGYSWWTQAKNQKECEAPMGCKILDTSTYNLPYNFRFNNMTQEECTSCGADSFNQWVNKFSWTGGVWQPGIPVKAQWRKNQYIKSGVVKNVLDYQYLFEQLDNSVNTHIADLYRSEVLCRMERVEGNLRSVSCSCSGFGSPDCFTSSSLLLGQTKPCQGEDSTYSFSYGEILFYKDSVQLGCTSVLISQVSQQLYKSTTAQTLSSNFVSYKKPNNYGVMNDNDAIIGTILGDGVTINTQGVSKLSICLQFNGTKYSNDYKVYDFAMASTSNNLRPLDLETFTITTSDSKLLCVNLTNFSEDKSFFPIIRYENYMDQNKEYFDKTAQGLLYTLAVIFLLTSLWGIFQIIMVLVKKYKGIEEIRLVHFLILIVTLFILVRTIYFFIIPSGVLQNNSVGDYILVVLPTFIYFTAFTIIISLWYMIVNSKDSGKTLIKRLKAIILWTNVVLYLLFIVIVLVFNYTEDSPKNDCGSRIVIDVSSTTAQRVVSIVYAVIQALISLVIGAAFIYLGGTLFRSMRQVKSKTNESGSNQHQKKIFIVTFTCSIGFIIHCVFVLILVGANPSNIVFSFLGLIITEIIPSLSIFYCYNQGHFGGLKQSTNTVDLSYVTPNKETFSKTNKNNLTDSHFYSSSTNQSRNYSSSSNY